MQAAMKLMDVANVTWWDLRLILVEVFPHGNPAGNGINRAGSILGRRGSNLPQELHVDSTVPVSLLDCSVYIYHISI